MFIKRYWSLLSCYLLAYLTSSSSSFSSSGYSSQIPLNKPLVTQPVDLNTNQQAKSFENLNYDLNRTVLKQNLVINSNMVFRKKRAMS